MAKKKKNVVLDPNGNTVSTELPNVVEAIAQSDIATSTVAGMQGVLTSLGQKSEQYALPPADLFIKLEELGVDLETTTRLYAALKQAYLTAVYVVDGNQDNTPESRAALVTNLFSLVIGNAVFFRIFDSIPNDVLTDVVIIVTNLMFQMEAGNNDDTGASE